MTVTDSAPARLRNRVTATAAIVLIAIGGAGLATSADRPATDAGRPELSAHGDQLAASWIQAMDSQSHAVADRVDAVSQHGRDLLAQLSSLDPTRIADGLAAG